MVPSAREVVDQFNEAFNRHDIDAIMALMTDDCVFENTRPSPDGTRFEGQPEVRAFWEQFFYNSPQARFDAEDIFDVGDRCVVRWTYHWLKPTGNGHVRGVDVFRVRDGKVSEKLNNRKDEPALQTQGPGATVGDDRQHLAKGPRGLIARG
jgi:ketosteroid isomerase-like protein